MKTAHSKYTQPGLAITLNIYFDSKAFDFITPAMTHEQEEDFIRLICDSIEAALPRESSEKHFYIKCILRINNNLKFLITDGFMTDNSLIIPVSQQAYAKERIKVAEMEQLPTRLKLNNDLIKNMNDKLPLFEDEARKTGQVKVVQPRINIQKAQPQMIIREFKTEKLLDVIPEMTHIKKEIKNLAEHHLHILNALLTDKNIMLLKDPEALQIKNNLAGVAPEKFKEIIAKKINEIAPIEKEFADKTEQISQQISKKTSILTLFKEQIIQAVYEAANEFHTLILQKFQNAPPHAKKSMVADFNKKFKSIAVMTESGELNTLQETQRNLAPLTLENIQEIISNTSKENPGLLQKCNTSFTEESPELKIVLKHLGKLNEILPVLFKDDPEYAKKEMIQLIRIPSPRSFQFKFSEHAINYKKVVDAFCKKQKDTVLALANHYKKTLQINDIYDSTKKPAITAEETPVIEKTGTSQDLQKYKDVSDSILGLANKDHQSTEKFRKTAEQFYENVKTGMDTSLKPLVDKINLLADRIKTETKHVNDIMPQIAEIKSSIDITINHFLLHPDETADFNDLDKKMKLLTDKRTLLIAKNRVLEETSHRLSIYDSIIKRIREIDLSATKNNVKKQRDDAKAFLLQFMRLQHLDPAAADKIRQRILEQYAKVDSSALDIDKILAELSDIKNAIYDDLGNQRDIPTEKLELKFRDITDKMQTLDSTMDNMNQDVSGLKELSQHLDKSRP